MARKPEGVEVRHQSKCKTREQDGARCNCEPSYRATAFDRRQGKQIKRPWTDNRAQAINERTDLVKSIKAEQPTDLAPLLSDYARDVFLPGIESGAILNRVGDPYKPGVVRGYKTAFEQYLLKAPELDKRLDQIERADLVAVVGRMRERKLAAWTIKNKVNALRALYRYAHECQLLPPGHNPARGLTLQKGARRKVVLKSTGEKGEMVIRGPKDVLRMIEVLPESQRALFATAALSGLRRGELQALRVGQVDLGARRLYVRFGWDAKEGQMDLKTHAALRDVPILDALLPHLKTHLGSLVDPKPSDRFFPGDADAVVNCDTYLTSIRKVWDEHSIEWLRFHDARHTFASMMIAADANIKLVSRMMGHSSVMITLDTYGHLMPEAEQEAADKMNTYLTRVLDA